MGLRLPTEVADWLMQCNGALVGPGGLYGLDPTASWLDLGTVLSAHAPWQAAGWIPIAGVGNGNYYVVGSPAAICPGMVLRTVFGR